MQILFIFALKTGESALQAKTRFGRVRYGKCAYSAQFLQTLLPTANKKGFAYIWAKP